MPSIMVWGDGSCGILFFSRLIKDSYISIVWTSDKTPEAFQTLLPELFLKEQK